MFSLQGKTAIVTGAGSGIGRAVALLLAQQGAEVHLLDINAEALQDAVTQINNSGGQARAMACDVTSQQTIVDIVSGIPEINILVNSAGIPHIGNVETTSSEDFDRMFSINVKGLCSNYTIKILEGNMDTTRKMDRWVDEQTGKTHTNVFALANPCSFPDDIEEGDEFYFAISTGKEEKCNVCMAYYPVPQKRVSISVLQKPCTQ